MSWMKGVWWIAILVVCFILHFGASFCIAFLLMIGGLDLPHVGEVSPSPHQRAQREQSRPYERLFMKSLTVADRVLACPVSMMGSRDFKSPWQALGNSLIWAATFTGLSAVVKRARRRDFHDSEMRTINEQ